jgi:aspartate-semialdehyde dehydrogenase
VALVSVCVAVVGATGAVGEEIFSILEQRSFPFTEIRAFSSPRSAGKKITVKGEEITVQALSPDCFEGVDIALFSAGSNISQEWGPIAVKAGTRVIDNSSAFRMDAGVPLVVPEINANHIKDGDLLIANPNCTTIILLMALAPIHKKYGIKRGVVATYQAASGAGREAMEELSKQTRAILENEPVVAEIFPAPIGFNLIPHCDSFLDSGFTKEEMKVLLESRKILGDPSLNLSCTAVRVPVLRAHSEAVSLELENPVDLDELRALLKESPGLRVLDRHAPGGYPMPALASGRDNVIVGRIRHDPVFENGLSLFLSGDQLRKGAALNAVQIAELFVGDSE